jgi:alpha-D-ribose 1-methylphosphonate 5-phosphate C-P lyase
MPERNLRKRANRSYPFAFIDENAKREVRRRVLKAVAIPGYQVPFASRELPIGRGWGTGGLQLTMALIGPDDVLKVIDQGCDGVVNAVNLREFLVQMTGVRTTFETEEATIIQTRHRVPEQPLRADQLLVFQVPYPEPLYLVEPRVSESQRMHSEADYAKMWVHLYEDIAHWGEITIGAQYPVVVEGRYLMNPSPIPRWDVPKLNLAPNLSLFGAGREKRIYAVPPGSRVVPLSFDDFPFRVEDFAGRRCHLCGAEQVFLDELWDSATGRKLYACSDTAYCEWRRRSAEAPS